MQLFLGFLISFIIGYLAYRRGSLSVSGMLGAMLTGTLIFGLGGWDWGMLLIVFFASSSALSHFKEAAKEQLAEKFSKGSRRDLAQTLANGGLGAALAVANYLLPSPWWWIGFAAAMATVNADTWATELGVLAPTRPRLITTRQEVEAGTSGGITRPGTLAALGGATLIGWLAALFSLAQNRPLAETTLLFVVTPLAGLFGSLFDSYLGATVQAIYYCEACGKETERHPTHKCGQPTRPLRGWPWLNNDWVNFISSVAGAALALGFTTGFGLFR